ncbi:MAG TPA: glycosyl transferase family 2 [Nitrospiraceae bacterium]|jgi:glycosyltransferase involved in cell wall biosynthesis|nr:glycosyl transferase family 2 [Nitrospiraceae bacterium]
MKSIPLLSVIVPAYNEESVLEAFHQRLSSVLNSLPMQTEVLYVNDGSTDRTLDVIRSLRMNDHTIGIVDLSRNFGKEIAMAAGLDHAHGDAIVVIDADLQDPPELIPELIQHWQQGYDGVYAVRLSRQGESWLKKITAHFFYRLINRLSGTPIPEDTGDFRLLSRRAVDSLKGLHEQHRFTKGLFTWIGYPQKAVHYHRNPRLSGKTKWNYWRLWNFALEGITSFTTAPLKIGTYLGLLAALSAFLYAGITIYKTLAFGEPVRGYPSLMVVILFLGGIQLIGIGIIGEYLGRVFDETKVRPLYFLKDYIPPEHDNKST